MLLLTTFIKHTIGCENLSHLIWRPISGNSFEAYDALNYYWLHIKFVVPIQLSTSTIANYTKKCNREWNAHVICKGKIKKHSKKNWTWQKGLDPFATISLPCKQINLLSKVTIVRVYSASIIITRITLK